MSKTPISSTMAFADGFFGRPERILRDEGRRRRVEDVNAGAAVDALLAATPGGSFVGMSGFEGVK